MTLISWLAMVVFLAGCSMSSGRLWRTSLPNGEARPLPVELRDETGLVTGIDPAAVYPSDAGPLPAIRADLSGPTVLVVTWIGGCDQDAQLVFRPSHRGSPPYELDVSPAASGGLMGGCPGMAIGQGLRIHTAIPVPASSVAVNGVGQ